VLDSSHSTYSKGIRALQVHESRSVTRDRDRGNRKNSIPFLSSPQQRRFASSAAQLAITLLSFAILSAPSPLDAQTVIPAGKSISFAAEHLELSRTVRPWEFLSAVGTEAGLFGNESGTVEAWVYPLKILRDFHLRLHTDRRVIDADTLARTITAHPESVTILYTGDTYNIRETFFVPVNEPGAIIRLEIETEHPLEIEALFQRDFQLEWPAALGGTYAYYDEAHKTFYLGEETKKFVALIGSPTASNAQLEYATNYSGSDQDGFRLGTTQKGKETKLIVIAASISGVPEAEITYQHLLADSDALLKSSADYYRDYLARTISLALPDAQLQRAYDWSRISVLQGVVKNPYLGTGIVAGYRTSGSGQRPGFAWFFGRDSMWTSLAYDASGDFASARTALDFLSKFQRADGKIPHEIAQGANLVPWFTDYPYAFASADATPLYIITMNDYVTESGDVAFAREKWPSLEKAYAFLRSTYDSQGLPQNFGFGHGWVEGGPLLPVKTELYQSALGLEALRALSNLAHLTAKESQSEEIAATFEKQKTFLNDAFWLPETKRFAFALDQDNTKIDEPTVLATVPMWFGLLDQEKADVMISELAKPSHQPDWGMRIIANDSAKYSAGGYHFGAVWPLFTGWASVGEYRYHRAAPAYANLRANAMLALDGSLGHTTEVLSGDYYSSLSTSSPHQIWSAAMVVSPILRGMLGLATDAAAGTITLAPHIPADWNSFSAQNIRAGNCLIDFVYSRTPESITLVAKRKRDATNDTGAKVCTLDFAPALSLRATVSGASLDGRALPIHTKTNADDQHALAHATLHLGTNTIIIHLQNDFAVSYDSSLPHLGRASSDLHILSEEWTPSRDRLTLNLAGIAGREYFLTPSDIGQVAAIDGGELLKSGQIRVRFPEGAPNAFVNTVVHIHFHEKYRGSKNSQP